MATRDKAIGGNVEAIDLKIEVGGGIVKASIYSLAIFTNLTDLRVRKCSLEYVPEDIGDLSNLTHLDFAKNDIRWLPPSVTKLVNLKNVDVRNNLIFELPPMIGNCGKLEELRLDHNKLYDLPQSMIEMPILKKVTLDRNMFQILPGWLDELEHLKTLTFSYNEVDKLPSTFHLMGTTPTELRCTYNKLTQVSTMFTGLVRLKILDLTGNPIKTVPKHMGALEDLEELYVNYCSLETMDIHLAECRKVRDFLVWLFRLFRVVMFRHAPVSSGTRFFWACAHVVRCCRRYIACCAKLHALSPFEYGSLTVVGFVSFIPSNMKAMTL